MCVMLDRRAQTFGPLVLCSALVGVALPVACGGDSDTNVVTGASASNGAGPTSGSQAMGAGGMSGTGGSTLQFMDGPMTGVGSGGDMSMASSSSGMGEGGTGMAVYAKDFVVAGTTANDVVQVYDIAVDKVGNIVVVGSFQGNIDFDGAGATPAITSKGGFDAFVAKFDKDGVLQWVKAAGTNDPQTANSVTIDKDNRIGVCGTFRGSLNWGGNQLQVQDSQYSDAFAVVFDTLGTHIASQRYGANSLGKSDLCNGAAFDATGNLVITGQFQGSIGFGTTTVGDNNGDFKIYLAKLTPNMGTKGFNEVFAKAYASPGVAAMGQAVTVDLASGDIALGGFTEGPISFGGAALTPKYASIRQAFVARFDGTGQTKFNALLHSEGESQSNSVAFHTNGDLVVGGVFKKSIDLGGGALAAIGASNDAFVGRFDKTNKLVFGVRIGDGKADDLTDIVVDPAGFPVFGGSFQGTPVINSKTTLMANGIRDGLVVKLANDDGHGYWGFGFGDVDFQEVKGVATDPSGNVYFAGTFKGTIDLGGGTRVAPNGSQALFVGKFLP